MELHHDMHHKTYVNSFNSFSEQLAAAEHSGDIQKQIALQPLINFHGGGHINHSLFWKNLAPKGKGGGEEPSGELAVCIIIPLFEPLLHSGIPKLMRDQYRKRYKTPTPPTQPSKRSSTQHWHRSKAPAGHGL